MWRRRGRRVSWSTTSRRASLLLQQPPRLLRGDREVPRRTPHLGVLDARRVRRHRRTLAQTPVPRADVGHVAHCAAAREQRRTGCAARVGGGPRWRAVFAHRQLRRGARTPFGQSLTDRAAHPADHRRRDRRRSRRGPARWVRLRGVDDRRDGTPGGGGVRPAAKPGDGSMLEGVYSGIEDGWFVRARSPTPRTSSNAS